MDRKQNLYLTLATSNFHGLFVNNSDSKLNQFESKKRISDGIYHEKKTRGGKYATELLRFDRRLNLEKLFSTSLDILAHVA